MAIKLDHSEIEGAGKGHVTTRRGFITGMGFGMVSLYGLWAAYGAAPLSLGFLSEGSEGMAMGMHGGGGMSVDEFRRLTEAFIDANSLPDGSVRPGRGPMDETTAGAAHEDEGHGARPPMAMAKDGHGGAEMEPIDVYVIATRYGYEPDVLRLDVRVPYKFRFMAVDADHGASILFRVAGHMIRCPAKTLAEKTLTFTAPGEYLVYCTVYCGEGHDTMMGKIIVA